MRKGTWGAAAILPLMALVCAGTASAADLYVPSAPAPSPIYSNTPAYNWTGFYAGVSGGYGSAATTAPSAAFSGSIGGLFGGGQIGYNYQTYSNLVLGVEADLNLSGISGTVHTSPDVTQRINWFGTFRGRLGYAFNNIMPYVTGGVAFGGSTRTTTAGGGASQTAGMAGWTVGAGVEMGLKNNWSVKAEYQYIDFSPVSYASLTSSPTVDQNAHVFKIGLNKRF